MIRLYTSSSYFKDDETIIDNEAFFNNNVSAKYLTDSSLMTMQTINICGVVYIGSKIFHFISVVIKFILREIEK